MSSSPQPAHRAILLRDDEPTPRVLALPSDIEVPPNRVRVPSEFAGASSFDVYELVDDRAWPEEATYQMASSVPRGIDDLPEHERDNNLPARFDKGGDDALR